MAMTGFRIKSLAKSLDRSDPDRKLCPVRGLRYYLKGTETILDGNESLFIPLRQGAAKGKLSPNTILGCLKQSIQLAYQVAGKDEALKASSFSPRSRN